MWRMEGNVELMVPGSGGREGDGWGGMYTRAGGCRQWYAVSGCMMKGRNEEEAAVCSGGGKGVL